ncbi:DUF4129 domain-containing protein [Natrialba taiwanensis]|uniref:DUF4129 domain-containing protein n=1 Tax=Natrialba taiwanensis TaxID=160846 RepID=UPI00126785C8|nr:DUF4129 domain-containing protein [Natrialba taiwanensis]
MYGINIRSRHQNALLIIAALLLILTLGIAANVLESTPIDSSYAVPTESNSNSGLSLWGVLLLLINSLLDFLGINIGGYSPENGAGSWIEILNLAFTTIRSVAFPLVILGVVTVIALLTSHHLPKINAYPRTAFMINGLHSTKQTSQSRSSNDSWPPTAPENSVAEAWLEMVKKIDVSNPHSRTTEEWADAALAAGYNEEAVKSLTKLFRETQYGGVTVTTDRERKAKREFERLEGDTR